MFRMVLVIDQSLLKYEDNRRKFEEAKRLLELIRYYYGIPYEVWYVDEVKTERIYEEMLKPKSRLIRENSEILCSMGIKVYVETVARKFKSRSGYIYLHYSLLVLYNDEVIWAGWSDEVLEFLTALVGKGVTLLDSLKISIRKGASVPSTLTESNLLSNLASLLEKDGYEVFINVRHNMNAGEEPTYLFTPDADIIAIRENEVLGFEVKGYRRVRDRLEPAPPHEDIGEAIMYLANPLYFNYMNTNYSGGVFDKVYLCYPKREDVEGIRSIVEKCTPIGLLVLEDSVKRNNWRAGMILEAKRNPLLNEEKKRIMIKEKYVLLRYAYAGTYKGLLQRYLTQWYQS